MPLEWEELVTQFDAHLPREIWVLRVVLSKGVEYVLSLPVLLAFLVFYLVQGKTHLNGWLVLFPVGVLLEFIAAVGLGLLLAPVTALVTDTRRICQVDRFRTYTSGREFMSPIPGPRFDASDVNATKFPSAEITAS